MTPLAPLLPAPPRSLLITLETYYLQIQNLSHTLVSRPSESALAINLRIFRSRLTVAW
ncbi:hypothetical protein RUND412_011203, partial [Rhizina undulata]